MKRIKASGYVFTKSLTSPSYAKDIVKTNFSFSLKYFAVLAFVASIFSVVVMAKDVTQDLFLTLSSVEETIVSSYPEDLIITLENGELSTNQPEPKIFEFPERTEGDPENLLVFDSNGTLEDLNNYDTLILVNKTNVLVRGNGNIEVYPLADFPNTQITSETVRELAVSARPFLNALPYIALFFVFIATLVYYFGFRLVYLIIVAAILGLVGLLAGLKLKFAKYYQIAIHAITLPLVIEVLAKTLNFSIMLPFWFLTLNVLVGIVWIASLRKHGFNDVDSK